MLVEGKPTRSLELKSASPLVVEVIDQRWLPHELERIELRTVEEAIFAIKEMQVRGAPLIGLTGAFALLFALQEAHDAQHYAQLLETIKAARPTAVNLVWAVDKLNAYLDGYQPDKQQDGLEEVKRMIEEDVAACKAIGQAGLPLIEALAAEKNGAPVNILTHCNAGWIACIDYGTATSPIYQAHDQGIPVHVWVDETRPRNQGAHLTAWELGQHGVPHTVICDNAGGHLMQHGEVDLVVTGADRVTRTGDAANKIGTYLKALAAYANKVPFYVALPASTFDFAVRDGVQEIEIENRRQEEVTHLTGWHEQHGRTTIRLTPPNSPALNPAFDVTPAGLITGLLTDRGPCDASEQGIMSIFPEAGHA